jgi:hypothetical protein
MPRPIFGPQSSEAAFEPIAREKPQSPAALAERLRVRRSAAYLEALQRLDAGAHAVDRVALQAVIDAVAVEFPELRAEQRPAGLVARCGLPQGFEVHSLDVAHATAVHVRPGERLPDGLEVARALALHPNYAFVEVFPQSMHAVRPDGTVTVVPLP